MKKQFALYRTICYVVSIFCATMVAAQPKKIYIALDDHTDYVYALDEEDHRKIFLETLDYYLDLADATSNNPSEHQSRWNCDGSFWLWTYEKNKSATEFERLINRVRDGHISAPLNALVSTYGAQPSEAVLRGMYYAGTLERRFGLRFPQAVAMENATIPLGLGALWAGAGARYSWRGICGCASKTPYGGNRPDVYWWQGLDGSRVLMKWNYFYPYEGASIGDYQECRIPERAVNTVETNQHFLANWPYNIIGIFGKGGDDAKTLTDDFVKFAQANTNSNRQIIVSNQEDFFRDFEANYGAQLQPHTASYGNEWDLYCASMAEVSASVKRSIEKLRGAEAIQTLVSLKNPGFLRDRVAERDQTWMNIGLFWEHDWTADGAIRDQRDEWQRKIGTQITSFVDKFEKDSAAALGAMIPNPTEFKRFYAFNQLSWTRTDFADVPYVETDPAYVVDISTGLEAPSQIVTVDGQRFLRVLASDIPPVGYKVFEIRPGAPGSFSDAAAVSGNVMENAFYRLTIGNNGAITSLIDKTRGEQEFAREINGRYINDLGPSGGTFEIESVGPVSVTVKITADAPLNHTTRITLFRDSDRIELRNEINQNFSDVYTWGFGFNLETPDTWHEEVGAVIRAKQLAQGGHYADRGARLDWQTLNHFADMTGSNNTGVTLSNADCYFMRVGNSDVLLLDSNTPQLSPLVGGQVDGPRLGISDQGGDSKFLQRFALRTHSEYDAVAAMRFALEHQNPFVTSFVTNGNGYPETSYSLVNISDPNVVLWSIKPAEEGIGQGIIARVYNVTQQAATATLQLANPINNAVRTSHIETNLEGAPVVEGNLSLTLTPQQYQTFRLFTSETISDVPPNVSLIGPGNGATFATQTSVRLNAFATDADGAISKVEFFNGKTKLGESTSAPFALTLDSLPAGKYQLTAKATDNRGKAVSSSPVRITVTNTTTGATSVSAASYQRVFLARGSIASAFGAAMATGSQNAAGGTLPTNLIGTSITIKDSLGRQRLAPLFYVSPTQINYQIPEETATGTVRLSINSPGLATITEFVQITSLAPGLFSAQANGQGLAAADVTRIRGDGSRSEERAFQFDAAQNRPVAIPIDLGPATDRVFLILYGTGLRARNARATATIGGVAATVEYFGTQGGFVGLDQVNILLPRALIGRGEVDIALNVQGQAANPLRISIK
ncbi:MAG TPA: Ig-like domain-containing protein [Blastocatellia bacterium]|nr:Ig-like domain-containing protein [Blastocatellia bacterium]